MNRYKWLDNQENQNEVRALLQFALEDLQPEEMPLLDGLYENYIELAGKGDVILDQRRRPFNFAGAEDVISVWLIPLTIEVANSIIIAAGLFSLKKSADHLRHHSEPSPLPKTDEVRECVRQALDNPSFKIDKEDRELIENALVRAVNMLFI